MPPIPGSKERERTVSQALAHPGYVSQTLAQTRANVLDSIRGGNRLAEHRRTSANRDLIAPALQGPGIEKLQAATVQKRRASVSGHLSRATGLASTGSGPAAPAVAATSAALGFVSATQSALAARDFSGAAGILARPQAGETAQDQQIREGLAAGSETRARRARAASLGAATGSMMGLNGLPTKEIADAGANLVAFASSEFAARGVEKKAAAGNRRRASSYAEAYTPLLAKAAKLRSDASETNPMHTSTPVYDRDDSERNFSSPTQDILTERAERRRSIVGLIRAQKPLGTSF